MWVENILNTEKWQIIKSTLGSFPIKTAFLEPNGYALNENHVLNITHIISHAESNFYLCYSEVTRNICFLKPVQQLNEELGMTLIQIWGNLSFTYLFNAYPSCWNILLSLPPPCNFPLPCFSVGFLLHFFHKPLDSNHHLRSQRI